MCEWTLNLSVCLSVYFSVCLCVPIRYDGHAGYSGGSAESVTMAMKDLFKTMDSTSDAIPPVIFLQVGFYVWKLFLPSIASALVL